MMVNGGRFKMRQLIEDFANDLKNVDGILHPLLERVIRDHTLHLAIRNNYINIYYRGGNLLRVEKSGLEYRTFFDEKYNKDKIEVKNYPSVIACQADSADCVNKFRYFKEIMDLYFSHYSKPEREFQQLVVRENNFSTISNGSEYFISDIEFADSKSRFDMLGIHWPASERKDGFNCRPVIIEMKYGDDALEGKSGLMKHLNDIHELISVKKKRENLFSLISDQCNQLKELGLLNFNCSKVHSFGCQKISAEVIFILANHNPRSTVLKKIINSKEIIEFEKTKNNGEENCEDKFRYDINFFVSSFSGYAMHSQCMFSIPQMRKILDLYN